MRENSRKCVYIVISYRDFIVAAHLNIILYQYIVHAREQTISKMEKRTVQYVNNML